METVKAACGIIRDLGVTTAVLFWFMGSASGYLPSPAATTLRALDSHREFTERVLAELAATAARQQRLLAIICTGISDPAVKVECLR